MSCRTGDFPLTSPGGLAELSIDRLPAPLLLIVRGHVVAANVAARDLLQTSTPDNLTGCTLDQIVTVLDPDDGRTMGSHGAAYDHDWQHARATRADGIKIDVLIRITGDTGETTMEPAVVTLAPVDTAHVFRAEATIRATAHHQIVRLFANLAHEMRTPLNAVIGFGQILAGKHFGPLSDKYSAYADDIVGAGQHLLGLVNGALDLGRVGAGPGSLDERAVELGRLLESALAMVASHAAGKSIRISVPDATGMPVILADETRLRQVLINLLSNAIKYTPDRRRIGITYKRSDDELLLTVWDDGDGMTADQLETAMLPFGRTETAMRSGEAGTGLGLPICKAIAEAHEGSLEVESSPGHGTRVTVSLPSSRIVAEPGIGGLLSRI